VIMPFMLLMGALLGALLVGAVFMPRLRMLKRELQMVRRERDYLQRELAARRSEATQQRAQSRQLEHDLLTVRRRVAAVLAERDQARLAQLSADTDYRELLAERDRLLGEQALARRRRALP
jgi:septal ring factor EnvC (AmiA/AmiB activator)